jgi:hypothetical protein
MKAHHSLCIKWRHGRSLFKEIDTTFIVTYSASISEHPGQFGSKNDSSFF